MNPLPQWSPDSWRSKPSKQIPFYRDEKALASVEARLANFPPLVCLEEIDALKKKLCSVCEGNAFLLQGGDCVEIFTQNKKEYVHRFLRTFLQISAILALKGNRSIINVGRIAGQFAKPRSFQTETLNGVILPAYQGDMINGFSFDPQSRTPDPQRQEKAYEESSSRLNLLRFFLCNNFPHASTISAWIRDFLSQTNSAQRNEFFRVRLEEAVDFFDSRQDLSNLNSFHLDNFYTSHEALLLGYEEALTRKNLNKGQWYATSAHMLWIGDRTRQIDHAHVEYCRGIENPIGLKCGPDLNSDELMRLIDHLNPQNEAGKLVLITRCGANKIGHVLPTLLRSLAREGRNVIWSCDPMHGNTRIQGTLKMRFFDAILKEIVRFFEIHQAEGTNAGGIHIEMTGENVAECLEEISSLSIAPIDRQNNPYHTRCDPRLNLEQSLEVSLLVSDFLNQKHKKNDRFLSKEEEDIKKRDKA